MEPVPSLDGGESLARALDWVRAHPLPGGRIISVCLWGEMGVGKTQMVGQYARRRRIGFRVYHPAHDGSRQEALGASFRDPETNRTRYAVPDFLPSGTEITALNPTGILLIDELNRADSQVLSGLFELIGEGRISQSGYNLPPGWQIVCCANPQGSRYQVQELDPALVDRMLHLRVGFDSSRWQRWATSSGLEEDIVRFVDRSPEIVFGGGGAGPGVTPCATPRSLELFGTLYEPSMPADLMRMTAHGLLGPEAAERFLAGPRGAERALTGPLALSGLWERYLPRWGARRPELVRQTLANVVETLAGRPRDAATGHTLCRLRECLDAEQRAWLDAELGEVAPQWLSLALHLAGPVDQA